MKIEKIVDCLLEKLDQSRLVRDSVRIFYADDINDAVEGLSMEDKLRVRRIFYENVQNQDTFLCFLRNDLFRLENNKNIGLVRETTGYHAFITDLAFLPTSFPVFASHEICDLAEIVRDLLSDFIKSKDSVDFDKARFLKIIRSYYGFAKFHYTGLYGINHSENPKEDLETYLRGMEYLSTSKFYKSVCFALERIFSVNSVEEVSKTFGFNRQDAENKTIAFALSHITAYCDEPLDKNKDKEPTGPVNKETSYKIQEVTFEKKKYLSFVPDAERYDYLPHYYLSKKDRNAFYVVKNSKNDQKLLIDEYSTGEKDEYFVCVTDCEMNPFFKVSGDNLIFGFANNSSSVGNTYLVRNNKNIQVLDESENVIHELDLKLDWLLGTCRNPRVPLIGDKIFKRTTSSENKKFYEVAAGPFTSLRPIVGAKDSSEKMDNVEIGSYVDGNLIGKILSKHSNPDSTYWAYGPFNARGKKYGVHIIYNSEKGEFYATTHTGNALERILFRKREDGKWNITFQSIPDEEGNEDDSIKVIIPQIDMEDNNIDDIDEVVRILEPGSEKSTKDLLDDMVGLEKVKKQLYRFKASVHKEKGNLNDLTLHMCFTGNPGTGKTEVAKLVAGYLCDEGVLTNNEPVCVTRTDLVGEYIGQSGPKVRKAVEKAMNGVLFIDEAYTLYVKDEDKKDFGNEVIAELVKSMSELNGKICVIFAGYEKETMRMIRSNPGLKSRVSNFINFPNYSLEELKEITRRYLKKIDYQIDEDAFEEVSKIIDKMSKEKDFANARDAQNVIKSIKLIQNERTYEDELDRLIKLEDVKVYEDEHDIKIVEKVSKKPVFNVKYDEFMNLSMNREGMFIFDNSYIEEASVRIELYENGEYHGNGSGSIITPNGLIATCSHVVHDQNDIKVVVSFRISNGQYITKKYDASLISEDTVADVALIGINEPDVIFPYYPLLSRDDEKPEELTSIAMGGYPFGSRFDKMSINKGAIQSYNRDTALDDEEKQIDRIYVDMQGRPGNSGSGVIDTTTGKCIGVYCGAAVGHQDDMSYTIGYAVEIKYLWNLIKKLSQDVNEPKQVLNEKPRAIAYNLDK